MESSSLFSSKLLLLRRRPFVPSRKFALFNPKRSQVRPLFVRSNSHDWGFAGRSADEDMIVLRKRIHEMKMAERNYEPPSNWMEWEKRYYTRYDSDVCEAVGLLQMLLMNIRPSLALTMAVIVALSVPTSTAMILFHVIELAKSMLSGL